MRLLRNGLATVAEAAQIAMVSRQRVLEWCNAAGIDVRATRGLWLAKQIVLADQEEHKMAKRNWANAKGRKPTEDARFDPGIMAPLIRGKQRPVGPSKDELRALAATAAVPVKRFAAVHTFRCLDCREYNRRRTQLQCAKCGSKNIQRAV